MTGVVLNHASHLEIRDIKIHHPLLNKIYGLPETDSYSYSVGANNKFTYQNPDVLLGNHIIGKCPKKLAGGAIKSRFIVIACENNLQLLDKDFRLIEIYQRFSGLPGDIVSMAKGESDQIFIKTKTGTYIFDIEQDLFSPAIYHGDFITPEKNTKMSEARNHNSITLDKLLLDIHSGRISGSLSLWLWDLVSICLVYLSLSGVWMHIKRRTIR
jgi:hypothetical protein